MSSATHPAFAKDSWQSPRNARTLRAYMALQNQEIAGRIRELRGRRPQTVVADALGVAERTYQNWEAGEAKPNYRSLQKLAEYYGVGEDYILTGSGESTPTPFVAADARVDQLDRIEALLHEARDEQDRISNLLETVLGRLGQLEDDLSDGLAQAVETAARGLAAESESEEPAPKAPKTGRSRSRAA